MTSRRASRYFRNALLRLDPTRWQSYTDFVYARTPELSNLMLRRDTKAGREDLDLFFTEDGTRHEREIGWAGDGIQIWIQALFHLWRQPQSPILVLDEPDVFLHPDLQRRLARTVFGSDRQTVIATHSLEILAEASAGSAVWIDRNRRTLRKAAAGRVVGNSRSSAGQWLRIRSRPRLA